MSTVKGNEAAKSPMPCAAVVSRIFGLLRLLEEEDDSSEKLMATEDLRLQPELQREPLTPRPMSTILESSMKAKPALMTLHFIFPHEILPALDLLDRRLIQKLHLPNRTLKDGLSTNEVFYIQSSSGTSEVRNPHSELLSSRFKNAWDPSRSPYEVRLDSWNCSCPAFAYSNLRLLTNGDLANNNGADSFLDSSQHLGEERRFGGIITNPNMVTPVCKHILAAFMVTAAPTFFESCFEDCEVSSEKMAALAVGWNGE